MVMTPHLDPARPGGALTAAAPPGAPAGGRAPFGRPLLHELLGLAMDGWAELTKLQQAARSA